MGRGRGGILLLVGALAVWGGPARGGDALRAAIPFEFTAGETVFPKGNCDMDVSSGTRVSIACSRVRAVVQASALPFSGNIYDVAGRKEIVFNRYGKTYFLSRVFIKNEGRELTKSAAEEDLLAKGEEGKAVVLKVK